MKNNILFKTTISSSKKILYYLIAIIYGLVFLYFGYFCIFGHLSLASSLLSYVAFTLVCGIISVCFISLAKREYSVTDSDITYKGIFFTSKHFVTKDIKTMYLKRNTISRNGAKVNVMNVVYLFDENNKELFNFTTGMSSMANSDKLMSYLRGKGVREIKRNPNDRTN